MPNPALAFAFAAFTAAAFTAAAFAAASAAVVQRRKLKWKAKLESSSSCYGF